jgi:hypothetical protein
MGGIQRPGDTFDVHHVLRTTVTEDGVVMLNIGDARGEIAADERVPLFQTPGVVSLPANPSAGTGGAEVMCLETSAGYIGMSVRDNRKSAIAGNVQPGETWVFGSGSQGCSGWKNDGSITHMTTENGSPSGPTVFDRLAPDGMTLFARWGKRTFDATGYHLFTFSGARFDLGGIGGLPAPLSSLGNYARLSAQMVSIEGAVVALGPRTGIADPAAKATPALATLSAIGAAVTALQSAVSSLQSAVSAVSALASAATPTPASAAAATAAVSAIAASTAAVAAAGAAATTAATAVTTAQTTLPSNCVTVT